ncbi:class D beta-lactamase [Oxalobacteraceae bacterium OTU3CINTB1]|nr:class D beta-lactamase [Oxalobacteraceae bacterium OTU3CINTB1]
MSFDDLLIYRFLLACAGCLAAGLGVWALLSGLSRRLPALASQRSVWLLGQVTIAAAFLVVLLPHSERLSVVPQIELPNPAVAAAPAPDKTASPLAAAGAEWSADTRPAGRSWLALGAIAWLAVYLSGLVHAAWRLLNAGRFLRGLSVSGSQVPGTLAGGAEVIEVDAPISPMLYGFFRARLLLPRHLRGFDPLQRQMMIEHEVTHLRRRDLQWMGAGLLLQTLFWFNPFMRLLRARLSWAQELGCDREVLRGRPPAQRKAYAAALLAQLKMQGAGVETALAFGGAGARLLAARIGLIRAPSGAGRSLWLRLGALAGLAGIFAGTLAFQPALAWRIEPLSAASAASRQPFSCLTMADAASGATLAKEGHCDERVTPASTFNIVVSLMGYDSGILTDTHTPMMPFKAGYTDYNESWRQDTDPTLWFKNSVLWFAQQVTAALGMERFRRYIDGFNYGNRDVSGDAGKDNGLSLSWVGSSLKISPVEQVAFLRKMVRRELPLSPRAYEMTSRIMAPVTLSNGWTVQGKTGTAGPVRVDDGGPIEQQYGWYVGWASKGDRTVVFAHLVLDHTQDGAGGGPRARAAVLRELPARLDKLYPTKE